MQTMTTEIQKVDGIRCTECKKQVQLKRRENRTLSVECNCSARSIKVATLLPEGWE